jgi:hypothetical protein
LMANLFSYELYPFASLSCRKCGDLKISIDIIFYYYH